jgi:hypothetical protein
VPDEAGTAAKTGMMLTLLAFLMIATFMALIMTKRLSALIALIVDADDLFAIDRRLQPGLGDMMLAGVRDLAPTGVMLLFAILYFGLMIDVGLFDPLVKTDRADRPWRSHADLHRHRRDDVDRRARW